MLNWLLLLNCFFFFWSIPPAPQVTIVDCLLHLCSSIFWAGLRACGVYVLVDAASLMSWRHFPLDWLCAPRREGVWDSGWTTFKLRCGTFSQTERTLWFSPLFQDLSLFRKWSMGILKISNSSGKGGRQKLRRWFFPLRRGGIPHSAKLFWAQWFPVKGGGRRFRILLRKKSAKNGFLAKKTKILALFDPFF